VRYLVHRRRLLSHPGFSLKIDDAFRYSRMRTRVAFVYALSCNIILSEMKSQEGRKEWEREGKAKLSDVMLSHFAKERYIRMTDRKRKKSAVTAVKSDNWTDFDVTRITLFIATRENSSDFPLVFLRRIIFLISGVSTLYRAIAIYNISRKNASGSTALDTWLPKLLSLLPPRLSFHCDIVADPFITKNEAKWIAQRTFIR